jgi:HEAT repeat protein
VRERALFWLGQRAGAVAARAIATAVREDPELEVKKKAVFALSQLPAEEGVPLLIEVAETHPHPEVRKQAFFWLGQSEDPRALDLFERVLLRK